MTPSDDGPDARDLRLPLDYRPEPGMLRDRVVLVTGAAHGIGRALARGCAGAGATVVLLDRAVRVLERLYDEICDAGLPEPAIYPMNLAGAEPGHYEELAARIEADLGRLDALVNNAAWLGTLTPVESYELAVWAEVVQVNLHAPFLLSRACLPLLRRAPEGRLIFCSDSVGRRARAYWGAYAVSKFGLEGLMQLLAEELERNTRVRVCSIDPGPVRTALRGQAYPLESQEALRAPDDVVPAFLYVLGPSGAALHGCALEVP